MTTSTRWLIPLTLTASALLNPSEVVAESPAIFTLSIRFEESPDTAPRWRHPEANALESVRLDLIQSDEVRASFFADMRSRRRMSWEASPDTIAPFSFDIDLSDASGIHTGPCSVRVSRWGFLPQETEVNLYSGGSAELSAILTRDPLFPTIVSPRLTSAVTRLAGDSLIIEIDADRTVQGWSASLSTEHFSRPLKILRAEYGRWMIRHEAEPGWCLLVQIPPDTPEELYDLQVSNSLGTASQPNAVNVLLEYPDPIYLTGNFHHALDSHRLSVDGEIASLFRETVNIIRPAFYANVDDIGYEDERVVARIADAATRHLDVPYFGGLGNHDRGGIVDYGHYPHEPYPDQPMSIEYYRHYFGTRYQSRDIGPLHIVLPYCPDQWETHAARPDQDRWLKEDLLAHKRSGLRLFMCHHLTWWHRDGEPWQITDLLDEQYGLNLVLLERAHRTDDGTIHRGPVPTYYGGLAKSPKLELIGLLEISKLVPDDPRLGKGIIESQPPIGKVAVDSALAQTNYSTAVEKEERLPTCDTYVSNGYLVRDCTLRKFEVTYAVPGTDRSDPSEVLNQGTETALSATINRDPGDNPIVIQGGRLKFVMASGIYAVEGGEIIQQVDSDDQARTIVYVKTDIGHPNTQVTVRPAD